MKKQASEETLLILEAIHKLGTAIENLTYAVDHLRPDPAVEYESNPLSEDLTQHMQLKYDIERNINGELDEYEFNRLGSTMVIKDE